MRIGLFNANGIVNKVHQINDFVNNEKIDLMFITETHQLVQSKTARWIWEPFLNLQKPDHREITGGRRGNGGIAGFANREVSSKITPLQIDLEANFAIVKFENITIGVAYFSPATPNTKLTEFLNETLLRAGEEPCIIMGDFNARTQRTGDTHLNLRGRLLNEWLDAKSDTGIRLEIPTRGKWTTFSPNGNGIPDIVLTKDIDVFDFEVHEEEALGGSDHRPLTFQAGPAIETEKNFERWDLRKLNQEAHRKKYCSVLEENLDDALDKLIAQNDMNAAWETAKDWIHKAASESIGRIRYTRTCNNKFWTHEMIRLNQEIKELTSQIKHMPRNFPVPCRHAVFRQKVDRERELRSMMDGRKRTLFEDMVNEITKPRNKQFFVRMVKSCKKRQNESKCALVPEKLDTYAEYFETTFGDMPKGIFNEEDITEPEETVAPEDHFSKSQIQSVLRWVALGKASGKDQLVGEFYQYGGPAMITMLTTLFNKIYRTGKIPDEWKTALIVPVYKKKGSNKEIGNYRPIALTIVCRRLYERLLIRELEPAIRMISDFQGGFRRNRSTLDQILLLQEIMHKRGNIHNIFLDLKAAYDMVDRRRLWTKMKEQFNVEDTLIARLKDLFEGNSSELLVMQKKSRPILNRRGLFQGSSLSPILFNFFINDLSHKLRSEGDKVNTMGVTTNNLFFADDANIHATSLEGLKRMLQICEGWSIENGMEFAPAKCYYLGPARSINRDGMEVMPELTLYDKPLPKVPFTEYLGVTFGTEGVDAERTFASRKNKAEGVTQIMGNIGMNPTGWPLASSALVYKTFIRPTMEYGLALRRWDKPTIKGLQQTQNRAMRRMCGAPGNASINALQKLLLIEPVEVRNNVLNAKFGGKLHNSKDGNIPVVRLWRNGVATRRKDSFIESTVTNPLWKRMELRNHLFEHLQHTGPEGIRKEALTAKVKQDYLKETFRSLKGNIAEAVELLTGENELRHRSLCRPKILKTRKEKTTIIRWVIGGVCQHQICLNCAEGDELSREHGIQCSGVASDIEERWPGTTEKAIAKKQNVLDFLVNKVRHGTGRKEYKVVSEAIEKILKVCRGYKVEESGFWRPLEQIESTCTDMHLVVPLTGNQSTNPVLTERRRQEALGRNRQVGRPWRPYNLPPPDD